MFATKFALKRVSPTRLHVFSPISSFVQVRFQRAEEAQPRSTSELTDDEPLPFDQIPGPRGRFPTVIEFYRQSDGFSKYHKLMQKLFKVYGPILKEDVTDKTPTVHVMEPADFETVYRAEGKYPDRAAPLEGLTKYRKRKGQPHDLVNLAGGEEWHRIRQALAPKMMRPKVLEENIDNFNSVTKDTIERLAKIRGTGGLEDGEIPDLEGELSKWATESVGTLVFDSRIGLYDDPPSEEAMKFIQAVDDMFKCLGKLMLGFVEKNLLPYMDTPSFKKLSKSMDIQNEIGMMYINKKIKELEEMANRNDKSQENQVVPLLTYLLAKKELTLDEVCSNTVTMFGAGVDTTAYTTLWLLYHLARNPTVQEKLHQEMYSILGKDGDVTAGSLAKLSYLKACGKESARMTPVFLANRRVLEKDVVLSGYLVPAKTIIGLGFYATGASEKHFKDASEYKPERWLRENKKDIHAYAILPFGFGPRMCIGSRIAELEMHLLVSKIIQRFRLEYHHEPLEMIQKLSAVPEKPVKIKFIERY
ncbi:1,25-dihydroxyvitamin D(3) 24-hydroxylase, mitochondrial-like [Oculina patagonica]